MKILHTVEFYSPSVGGSQEVVRQLSEHLVLLGHDVTVATTMIQERNSQIINGVKIVEFDISGNAVRGYHGKDINKYRKFLINSNFDIILNYAAQQWTSDLLFEVIDKIKAKKVFVPCGFSGLKNPSYANYFKNMPKILKNYDANIFLSNNYRDINFAKKHKVKKIFVIPNGADEREFENKDNNIISNFKKEMGLDNKILILTIGTHTNLKGHKECIEVYRRAKLQNSALLIIGNNIKEGGCRERCLKKTRANNLYFKLFNGNKEIVLLDTDRVNTIRALKSADIFLFLSNLECSPLVLFEAAAAGLPFISSDVGNAKEISNWTKSGVVVASDIDSSGLTHVKFNEAVNELEKLANNDNLIKKMSQNGREAWVNKFSWEIITKKYEDLYKKLTKI